MCFLYRQAEFMPSGKAAWWPKFSKPQMLLIVFLITTAPMTKEI